MKWTEQSILILVALILVAVHVLVSFSMLFQAYKNKGDKKHAFFWGVSLVVCGASTAILAVALDKQLQEDEKNA